jgi:tRNA-modifying protein YgfZ
MIPGRDNQSMQDTLNLTANLSITLNQPGGPLGIIRAQGADAVKFLQGQLTQDVALLGLSEARLAAWCSAKGRMLASFVVFKNTHDDILLLCSPSVLPATLKRLQMFVLRAQCKLTDATAAFAVQGLAGGAAAGTPDATHSIAARAMSGWAVSRNDDEITLQLPPGHHQGHSVPRALRITPLLAAQAVADAADSHALDAWQYLEVTSGIAPITAPISDAFVPQMLNYESIGGVNFKKGCYPGQEVVARSQFRGTLKRRGYIVSSQAPLVAGQELYDSRDTEQPCGTVAYAAQEPGSALYRPWWAVVSMQTSAVSSPRLLAAPLATALPASAPAGPDLAAPSPSTGQEMHYAPVELQTLPYALLEDI